MTGTTLPNSNQNQPVDNTHKVVLTAEEINAATLIKIASKVPAFIAYLQQTRPTASRQLFYDSFGNRRNDTPIQNWVRSKAIIFASDNLLPSDGYVPEAGAANV